jgi:two-component system, cell cycle sensor histidine kinase and response regulator CckA
MQEMSLRDESLLFQWNFFERAISNYSIIIKMFQHMGGENDLTAHLPRIFVEETVFDSCEVILRDEEEDAFFTVDSHLKKVTCGEIEKIKGPIYSPTVIGHALGYGTLYVYPFRRDIHVFAYLVLGKKKAMNLDTNLMRDLDLLCEILNRFMLLNMHVRELKTEEDKKTRQLDTRLALTRTLLENIIDQMPHAMFMVDRNGIICFANRSAKESFFEGKTFPNGEKIENVVQGIQKGFLDKDLILHGEIHHRKGDDYKLYTLESYPIKDGKGQVVFKSVILKDVVDERIEEEEHMHQGRMETIGKLAGGIAHDFNNVLTGILGYASLIKRMTQEDGQLSRYAEVIESSAKRAASLTEQLLNFSRRQRARNSNDIDLNGLVGDVLFLVHESFRNIVVETRFDETLPPIKGDAGELQHAILNLCINSKDAMPDGGTLKVTTEKRPYLDNREFAVITIEDSGCGIDERIRSQIFEPFFTTKAEGQKVGMGLYMVQKVIRSHGGFIELESGKEKGTTFTLYFPLSSVRSQSLITTAPVIAPFAEKKCILVVDDEEVVRGLLMSLLRTEGFDVLQAGDALEAISIFEEKKASIDLVVLDMIMPGMKGEEVLKRLREISRAVKVVVSSGYMSEEQRDKLQEYGVDGFLDKPYSDTEAVNVIRLVLSQAQNSESSNTPS